jgi:hypothetical protein
LDIQWMNNKYYEYDTDENDEQTFDFMDASWGYWHIGIENYTYILGPEKAIVNFEPL